MCVMHMQNTYEKLIRNTNFRYVAILQLRHNANNFKREDINNGEVGYIDI